jgi:hypothetical protein
MDTTLFYVILFGHLASLILAFGSVLVIDVFGLLWLFKKKTLSEVFRVAAVTQALIWIGWFGLVATGVPLLIMKGLVDDLTWLKIFLVGLAGFNGLFLDRIKKEGEKIPDTARPPARLIFRIALGSAISQLSWWGATIIGFYHGTVEHVVRWPHKPVLWMAGVILAIAVVTIAGTLLFGEKAKAAEPEKSDEPS